MIDPAAKTYLLVALGSALGGVGRFWISGILASRSAHFPVATLVVNISGSFLIGLLAAWLPIVRGAQPGLVGREFLLVGVLGGYTTFSAFSLQTLELIGQGAWSAAASNVFFSVTFCLAAVWLGHALGSRF